MSLNNSSACLASGGQGSGGAIREGGGAFSEREAAAENAYFKKLVCSTFQNLFYNSYSYSMYSSVGF
jgi:hypothetical protein